MQNKKRSPWYVVAVVGSMGTEVILLTVGGAWLGKKLDAAFGTGNTLLIIGLFLGLFAGLVGAAYTLKSLLKE